MQLLYQHKIMMGFYHSALMHRMNSIWIKKCTFLLYCKTKNTVFGET